MKYAAQYLASAASLLQQYDGSVPLAVFLKQHFKSNSKYGSKDRRNISHLCYVYFRAGHALGNAPIAERIRAALLLCETTGSEWSIVFDEEEQALLHAPLSQKWDAIEKRWPGADRSKLFPWTDELSEGIDAQAFAESHLVQPDLFLRIRPGRKSKTLEKLDAHKIPYTQSGDDSLALPNSTRLESVLEIDREVVIQDLSSQRIAGFLQPVAAQTELSWNVWDCCAASGGKSLLACDLIRNIQLTVSDVRPFILRNLRERFDRAGIRKYHSFVADLTGNFSMPYTSFNLILCDAPCSGSGTWGRTPEQLHFFTKEKIDHYTGMQRQISTNVIPYLAVNGYLLYITCSVFRKENEEMVEHILRQPQMQLVHAGLLQGYDRKADTMYAALFRKTS